MSFQRSGLRGFVWAAILLVLASGSAQAATLTVTNTADSGAGSLRQAIADAASGDTIEFSVTGTITLLAPLEIDRDLIINGPGAASLGLDGGSAVQLIVETAAVNFTLRNLTLANGVATGAGIGGGALLDNAGSTTTITGSVLSGNQSLTGDGGAILVNGNLTVGDSTFSGNATGNGAGGAIYASSGTVIIYNTLFSGNASDLGGAIANDANMTLTNVTLSGNVATIDGGGIFSASGALAIADTTIAGNSASYGGGIAIGAVATVTIQNSTFSGNSASFNGGGIDNHGGLTVSNTSLSGNSATTTGGGLYSDGLTLNLSNTLIANSPSGGDCNAGSIDTNDHNLVEDGSCTPALSGDPNLGPLADNGGATQTLALLTGSSAINTGNNASCLSTDQRGVARPQGATCDIGAYESPAAPGPVTVTSIPTLSEWGLLLLSLLVGLLGLDHDRRATSPNA